MVYFNNRSYNIVKHIIVIVEKYCYVVLCRLSLPTIIMLQNVTSHYYLMSYFLIHRLCYSRKQFIRFSYLTDYVVKNIFYIPNSYHLICYVASSFLNIFICIASRRRIYINVYYKENTKNYLEQT